MNPDNDYFRILIEKASKIIEAKKGTGLGSPAIQERLRTELIPVLIQLKDLIRSVAMLIGTGRGNPKELATKITYGLAANGISVRFDEKNEYTDDENPASIQFLDGKLLLLVQTKYKNSQDPEENKVYLKELIHEYSALLLITQSIEKFGYKITSSEMLQFYKDQLQLPGSRVGLAHVVDAILLSLIQEYTPTKEE